MNSKEDTLWLNELSTELLMQAKKWPKWMLTIYHPLAVLICVVLLVALSNQQHLASVVLTLVISSMSYKVRCYQEDIALIQNEIKRREQN